MTALSILDEIRLLERLLELLEDLRAGRSPDQPEELVELIATLAPGFGESDPSLAATFRDAGAVAADLSKLQVGPAPLNLPPQLAEVWTRNREAWLTDETRTDMHRQLAEALQPLEQSRTSLEEQQKSLGIRGERLQTLASLLSLLDGLAGLTSTAAGKEST